MTSRHLIFSARNLLVLLASAVPLLLSSCGEQPATPQGSAAVNPTVSNSTAVAKGADIATLPKRGKQRVAAAPAKAVLGMVYIDTSNNREYIFDGAEWVPHDQSIDAYNAARSLKKSTALIQSEVCTDGDPSCTPTGAHGGPSTLPAGHQAFDCKVCHKVGGRLSFDKNGPAFAAGKPAPTFDATTKTCSNIACHGVPSGTFSYYFPDGSGEPVLNTVSYGGTMAASTTPSWYSTGASACTACHGDPPLNGSNGANAWHSGSHAGGGPTTAPNQCQFCHPDASSPGNGIGDTITNPLLHANGSVNVQATFKSSCFNCH